MAESKAAWDQVQQEFRTLGRQVKQHYEESRSDKPEAPLRGSLVDKEGPEETAEPRAEGPPPADRRWRGAVVRALAGASDGLDRADLADAVQAAAAGRPDGWFDTLLARLEAEGMVATGADGRLRLPA